MANLKFLQIRTAGMEEGVDIIPSYINTIYAIGIYSMAGHAVKIKTKTGNLEAVVIPKEGYLEYLDKDAEITNLSFVSHPDYPNHFSPERFDGLVTLLYE